jgi:hypothetical protein
MKKLTFLFLILISLSVKGQTDLISEPFMVSNVEGRYYDSNHVLQYVEQLPEYVGFKYYVSNDTNLKSTTYPEKFTIYDREYSIGTMEFDISETDTLKLHLIENDKPVGSITIIQPNENYYTGESKFILDLVIDGFTHKFTGTFDHNVRY